MSQRLIVIFLLAGILRMAWALSQDGSEASIDRLPDQREYLLLGQNLLSQGQLSFVDRRFDQAVFAYRAPGYPVFVAMCGANVRVIRIVQCWIDASLTLAVYILARRTLPQPMGSAAALLGAGVVAVNPYLVYFSALILSETLYVALLAWGMALLLAEKKRAIAVGAAMLGLSVLTRPGAVALPVGVALAAAWLRGTLRPWPIVCTLVALLCCLGAWGFRNHQVLGEWIFTTTNGGITLYDGIHPGATGASEQAKFLAELMEQIRPMSEVQRDAFFHRLARDQFSRDPVAALSLASKKLTRTWSPVPLSSEFASTRNKLAGAGFAVPEFLLAIVGICRLSRRHKTLVYLLIPAVYFSIAHAVSVGSLRYRMPVEPMLAILAGVGMLTLLSFGKSDAHTTVHR